MTYGHDVIMCVGIVRGVHVCAHNNKMIAICILLYVMYKNDIFKNVTVRNSRLNNHLFDNKRKINKIKKSNRVKH